MQESLRIGVDVGGTFTDATLIDARDGRLVIDKVLTTPDDPSIGFLEAATRVLEKAKMPGIAVSAIVHATTVATNAIIEGKVARTAFVTTEGFRDMLELARQMRPSLYDLRFEKPRPMVERRHCFGIAERLDSRGEILVPLDEDTVSNVVLALRREEIETVAVCLLHSYINPVHERRVGELIRAALPDVFVSLSVDVAPEIREYLRASTTVINAAIAPRVARYLERIERELEDAGLPQNVLIMQSNGGVYSARAARRTPVFMVESGPAAGVIAASHLGRALGYANVLSLDMGGTTAKACLVRDGQPRVTKEYEVGTTASPGTGGSRGSGYPIRTPVIDLVEIGAGGGSIAWVDDGGALRVGPRSAGAAPGPACYARGGREPTVTDANLVLGRLDAHRFLGGTVTLDIDAALEAITRCGARLGLTVVETAHAIVEIANTAMIKALRLVSVQHGYDPRDFLFVVFGGAGPAHANRLATELGVHRTLIPVSAGVTSALGLLVTDLRREYTVALMRALQLVAPGELADAWRALEVRAREDLTADGIDGKMTFRRGIEMRYVGQSYELAVDLPDGELQDADLAEMARSFHSDHERAYGHAAPTEPLEVVNLRLTAIGEIAKPGLVERPCTTGTFLRGAREVYFAEESGYVECPVYDRDLLPANMTISGPAIIEEFDTSTVIHPGSELSVDKYGHLFISPVANSSHAAGSGMVEASTLSGQAARKDVDR